MLLKEKVQNQSACLQQYLSMQSYSDTRLYVTSSGPTKIRRESEANRERSNTHTDTPARQTRAQANSARFSRIVRRRAYVTRLLKLQLYPFRRLLSKIVHFIEHDAASIVGRLSRV